MFVFFSRISEKYIFEASKYYQFMKRISVRSPLFTALWAIFILPGFFFICGCSKKPESYIEDYYPLVYRGDLAFFEKDYEKSYELLEEAVAILEPTNFEPYRELEKLAFLSAQLGEPENALTYIDQLIDRGYELETFQRDTSFNGLQELPAWQELVKRYPEKRAAYLERVNLPLRNKIRKMNEADQLYRSRPDRQMYRNQQLRLDSLNARQLKDIFETWGYPGADLIGHIPPDSTEQLSVRSILMRTSGDMRQQYFIPKLREFVKAGTCPPKDLALVIDQYHLNREGYQMYATMTGPNGLFPVKDQRRLDERRQAIGLPTLKMEMQRDSVIRMSFYLKNLLDK
ncbi:hypothetical protein CRP01_19980 [Flavilitoribacter nigricans DSM 23189 = NBRC 102662]|uniref:Tetratricopeptide repeat protein n=1 Tax=Flavilitoribacter nigricans (strain ATCC 23147 / DSM 23189 / NBRC 102662 / NCIMB 1420 / SS-2) TaxID=1122177 RepID=A0A2D0NAJ2_FLAN2|nr:hypothetical protein CRP01_19980 [Flavilitoribacter nigricans DSM 23189 = NBRC 102662]